MLVENPEKHDLELTALEHGLKKGIALEILDRMRRRSGSKLQNLASRFC
jgi:hypothetical protein